MDTADLREIVIKANHNILQGVAKNYSAEGVAWEALFVRLAKEGAANKTGFQWHMRSCYVRAGNSPTAFTLQPERFEKFDGKTAPEEGVWYWQSGSELADMWVYEGDTLWLLSVTLGEDHCKKPSTAERFFKKYFRDPKGESWQLPPGVKRVRLCFVVIPARAPCYQTKDGDTSHWPWSGMGRKQGKREPKEQEAAEMAVLNSMLEKIGQRLSCHVIVPPDTFFIA
jgi:hypothetical protein